MNFQIFKNLSILGSKIFNFNLININKKFFFINNLSKNIKKIFFLKVIKLNIVNFFFIICIKYIIYGNNFIYFFLIYFINKHFFSNFFLKILFKKKTKLLNIIKINNIKLFKFCFKIKKNIVKKYNLNLTRKIVEKSSFKKILKTILL